MSQKIFFFSMGGGSILEVEGIFFFFFLFLKFPFLGEGNLFRGGSFGGKNYYLYFVAGGKENNNKGPKVFFLGDFCFFCFVPFEKRGDRGRGKGPVFVLFFIFSKGEIFSFLGFFGGISYWDIFIFFWNKEKIYLIIFKGVGGYFSFKRERG